jgi:quinol monooxygenase YgiN
MKESSATGEVIAALSLRFKPDCRDRVLERLAPAVEATRAEPGNRAFDVFAARDDADRLVLLERWESREALDLHLAQPYMREVLAMLQDTLAEPLVEGGNVLYLTDAFPVLG